MIITSASTRLEMPTQIMHANELIYNSGILKFLRNNIQDSKASIFVTSIDKLPVKFSLPLYIVINEDASSQPGSQTPHCFF